MQYVWPSHHLLRSNLSTCQYHYHYPLSYLPESAIACPTFFCFICCRSIRPCFHQNIEPKTTTMKLIQAIIVHDFAGMLISLFPHSQSSQTSRNFFGSSVITPSSPLLIDHLIIGTSFTVQSYTGRPLALASFKNREPK